MSAGGLLTLNALASSHHPDPPIGNHGAFDPPLPDRWIVPTGRRIRRAVTSIEPASKSRPIRPLEAPSGHRIGHHLGRRTAANAQAAQEEY